ncbi:serine/threonine protein kinase [Leptolyngbya sp. NIES-3755]|nr:serine/threonine protein kinase [Leptolyngbya sp. NIES-3755]
MYTALPPGTLLNYGKYEIIRVLGQGGFGITYEAKHLGLGGSVAIKEFYAQEYAQREHTTGQIVAITSADSYQRALQRFIREGRILEGIDHPNIVRVRDLFEERSTAYLVMDFIKGQTLREELEQLPNHRLRSAQIGVIIEALVSALETVHQNNIYHLDIKPENILITDHRQVKLIDFGAARQGFSSRTTRAYSPAYAAPEVIAGNDISGASDLFELGMVLYEMLVGEPAPTATQRLVSIAVENQDLIKFDPLEQPWKALLEDALHLRIEQRSHSVQSWWNRAQNYWHEQQKIDQQKPTIKAPPAPTIVESRVDRKPTEPISPTAKWTAAIVSVGIVSAIGYLNFAPQSEHETATTPAPKASEVAQVEPTTIPCNVDAKPRSLTQPPVLIIKDAKNGRNFEFYGKVDSQKRLQGEGTVIYSSGSRYDGNFLNGERQGCGQHNFAADHPTLKSYVGQFQGDRFNGLGILSFKNGNQYIGEFRKGHCEGRGVFILSDGTRKPGIWTNDESEGNPSCSTGV